MTESANAHDTSGRPATQALFEMTNGFWNTQLLHVAAKLRVPTSSPTAR